MAEWSGGRGKDRPDDTDPEHTRSPTTTGAEKTSGLTVARQEYNLDRGKRIDGTDRVTISTADRAAPENSVPTASPSDTDSRHNAPETVRPHDEVRNSGELNLKEAGLDRATEIEVSALIDIYDSNEGRLPDYINRGGGPGNIFENRPVNGRALLPVRADGYYREADVWSLQPNSSGTSAARGAERLVFGTAGEVYYTDDHYGSFVRLR